MKRLLAVLFFVAFFLNFSAPVIFAQAPATTATSSALPGRVNSDVPQNYGTHTQMVLIEVMAAISCQLTGVDPVNPSTKCLGVDPKSGQIGFVENGGGAIGAVGSMIAWTFDVPINTGQYIQHTASNFGVIKSTYAQEGHGFRALNPLLATWTAFRNIIYVLFVIIFMIMGIGIIFRFNIDPRSVMTIQNAIPKAVIVLILITFSYAISGFLIDIMYLFMYLFYQIMLGTGANLSSLDPTKIQGQTPFGVLGFFGGFDIVKNASFEIGHIITSILEGSVAETFFGQIFTDAFNLLNPATAPFYAIERVTGIDVPIYRSFSPYDLIGVLGGTIAFFIITFALLYALLRLWFLLLKAYLFILIDTVVAPIWIAGSLIPGSPLNAGSWFKHIFAYIAVFPVTLFMFLLGSVFAQMFSGGGADHFTPPFIGGAINPKYFSALIGIAVLLMTTEVVNMVKDTLKAPTVSYQRAVGAAFGVGSSAASAIPKKVGSKLFETDANGNPKGTGAIIWRGNVRPRLEQFWSRGPVGGKIGQMRRDAQERIEAQRLEAQYNAEQRARRQRETNQGQENS